MFPEENKRNERKFDISDRSSLAILGSFLDSWAARRCLWFLLQVIPRPRNNCLRPSSPVVQPLHLREPANSRGFTIEPSFSSLASRFMFLCSALCLGLHAPMPPGGMSFSFIETLVCTRIHAAVLIGLLREKAVFFEDEIIATCRRVGGSVCEDTGIADCSNFEPRDTGNVGNVGKLTRRIFLDISEIRSYL